MSLNLLLYYNYESYTINIEYSENKLKKLYVCVLKTLMYSSFKFGFQN